MKLFKFKSKIGYVIILIFLFIFYWLFPRNLEDLVFKENTITSINVLHHKWSNHTWQTKEYQLKNKEDVDLVIEFLSSLTVRKKLTHHPKTKESFTIVIWSERSSKGITGLISMYDNGEVNVLINFFDDNNKIKNYQLKQRFKIIGDVNFKKFTEILTGST